MKSENEPVTLDEFVLRLIWRDYYKEGEPPRISPRAFLPKPNEADGISVFRAACLRNVDEVLTVVALAKRDLYAIVSLSVADLTSLGLSVLIAPITTLPGHAVLPELNSVVVKSDPRWTASVQQSLAELASHNVLRTPTE